MSVKIRSMQTGTASSYKGSTPVNHPLGIYLEGPGNSPQAAKRQLARELGGLACRSGELGVLPPRPPGLAASEGLLCPLVSVPWSPLP